MNRQTASLPLANVRILDFTRVLAGPYCTALLADVGAEIIKVEPPAGDDYRHIGPFIDGESILFQAVNRGKRSIVLDLTKPADQSIALDLAAGADVVVENFRPGVADKLGVGFETLSAANPRLVYASVSGFGQTGPQASRPAYDIIIQALSGIMSVTGDPERDPTLIGESICDVAAGLFASWAILVALHERERTGCGRWIDLAMLDAMIALQPLVVARFVATGRAPGRVGNRHALSAPFGVFRTADGPIVIAVLNEKLMRALCTLIGHPDLHKDQRFATDAARLENEVALRGVIEGWTLTRSKAKAVAELTKAGVPAAVIQDIAEALTSPEAAGRELLHDLEHPKLGKLRLPQQPARFVGVERGVTRPAPGLGEHTREILEGVASRGAAR
jgi:CoA:oxalate CoA-transferase